MSINASSANGPNKVALFESGAHVQFVQESCISDKQQQSFEKEAATYQMKFIGSPLDPEHIKATAGVAALAVNSLTIYPAIDVTDDYRDAVNTGRCKNTLY